MAFHGSTSYLEWFSIAQRLKTVFPLEPRVIEILRVIHLDRPDQSGQDKIKLAPSQVDPHTTARAFGESNQMFV